MTLSQPGRGRLILEHKPWNTFLTVFVASALCLAVGFRHGPTGALVASGLAAWLARRGARPFEYLRAVFGAEADRVSIGRRTGRHDATASSHALAETGSADAPVTGTPKHPIVRLALLIPEGPHAGQHPLNLFAIPGRGGPDLALAVNSWLKHNR